MLGLSIKSKILGGFGLLTVAIIGLALMSYQSVRIIDDFFDEYRLTARQSVASYQMAQDFLQARSAALNYRSSLSESAADTVQAEVDEIVDDGEHRLNLFADSEYLEQIQTNESEIINYGNVFNKYRESVRTVANADALAEEYGATVRRLLSEIMVSAKGTQDSEAIFLAGTVIQDVLLARFYLENYQAEGLVEQINRNCSGGWLQAV